MFDCLAAASLFLMIKIDCTIRTNDTLKDLQSQGEGGTPYDDLNGKAPPERGTAFSGFR